MYPPSAQNAHPILPSHRPGKVRAHQYPKVPLPLALMR
jgi:hypothetical protein